MECAGQHQGEETAAAGGKGDRVPQTGASQATERKRQRDAPD